MIRPDGKGGVVNVWEDWRGNLYTVGSLVLYARMSGRSCEIAEGRIADIYEIYYGDDYRWHKLAPGEPIPEHTVNRWKDPETGELSRYRRDGFARAEVTEPRENQRRAKIMPTGRTSRGWGYWNKKWVYDDATGHGEFVETEQKLITLKITESITAVMPYDIEGDT